jgi:hypothetical protein
MGSSTEIMPKGKAGTTTEDLLLRVYNEYSSKVKVQKIALCRDDCNDYVAYAELKVNDQPKNVIDVCLFNWASDNEINVKFISEEMGPVADCCPLEILESEDLDTPTGYAKAWRKKCFSNACCKYNQFLLIGEAKVIPENNNQSKVG